MLGVGVGGWHTVETSQTGSSTRLGCAAGRPAGCWPSSQRAAPRRGCPHTSQSVASMSWLAKVQCLQKNRGMRFISFIGTDAARHGCLGWKRHSA